MGDAVTIHVGDCREVLRAFQADSIDAIVTDPPYGLGFMGKDWDHGVPGVEFWKEFLRVAKPGAHLVAFGGSRTYHRMACAIEDAGWEVRDCIMWIYGSGFPKSHNGPWGGTALKPAHEPIVVARKPLIGTVEANHARFGTGALNIDDCRVGWPDGIAPEVGTPGWGGPAKKSTAVPGQDGDTVERLPPNPDGRWPANVIHDGSVEVVGAFPLAPGQLANASTNAAQRKTQNAYGAMRRGRVGEASADSENSGPVGFKMKPGKRRLDSGSAARFFYCAKATRKDRNDGYDGLPKRQSGMVSNTSGQHITRRDGGAPAPAANNHPTVKPTELMRYLCRLVGPAKGIVLDPFMGSGSTGRGALLEGFDFIGIEQDADYAAIARTRIGAVQLRLPLGACA
ncbi:site-specific DNA-methyltransferase (adenine-specific) [Dyella jiangningensis]|uniref:DNA-methyltransferase n=1 Tax=Dyella sp. AtDHG13 TaxID=1938897 RepID=UPI00088C138A|nr:site-specific DNA-methyltransferase [Dyella sp. AtDHG13]PXV54180.1 site-specific DNA-methyltransferase (adenine-specific) [Dyella sp. AtDHG13]SDL05124.1 site-specific DNA-methyltransferase (adenine-specific) [Dyella jiangningensis]